MKFGLGESFVVTIVAFAYIQKSIAHPLEHEHDHMKRSIPSIPLTKPYRQLPWQEINFIHTTDTHGWLTGHQSLVPQQQYYSADLGEFASFVQHMKAIALEKDVDFLLVDSGDIHDGTGFVDGGSDDSIEGYAAKQFFKEIPYDVLSIGNHELYSRTVTLDMYTDFAPYWKGKYLTSNVNITVPINGKNTSVPVGSRYRKFTTRKGRSVTSFGVIYDFTGNDAGTTVQNVEDMVKEAWFMNAIEEAPDFFLLVGHMPVTADNWYLVVDAIRAVHKTTPILIFGGHTHIRDCNQPDGRSMALESGRYMETVGFMSVGMNNWYGDGNLTFERRYMDNNLITYESHTGMTERNYNTSAGLWISEGLQQLANSYNLSTVYGTAPTSYYMDQVEVGNNQSIFTLITDQALPYALSQNNSRNNIPNVICIDTGEARFDIYQGSFTKNDNYCTMPYTDTFQYIANVPASVATEVQNSLNGVSFNSKRELVENRANDLYKRGNVQKRYEEWLKEMSKKHYAIERRIAENLTEGYVTIDSCPGEGDDTKHLPLASYDYPDYMCSNLPPSVTNDSSVDLVFLNFIQSYILSALNELQTEKNYTSADVFSYSELLANEILPIYAQGNWANS